MIDAAGAMNITLQRPLLYLVSAKDKPAIAALAKKSAVTPAPAPPDNNEGGVIDVTNLVAALQSGFVDWATAYIFGLEIATPGLQWVALPIISNLDQYALRKILTLLSQSVVLQAFFLATALRKASQAQDYQDAVTNFQNAHAV